MATSIPTFKLEVTEGMIDVNASADRLYGYCIEASKGPVMVPTFCASATEVERIFGVDFKPHFYQNPTGIVICRVGFDNMAKASVTFNAHPLKQVGNEYQIDEANTIPILTIESTSEGPSTDRVVIAPSKSGKGYNVSITTDVTSKTYQNVSTLEKVVSKINSRFGSYLVATLSDEYTNQIKEQKQKFTRDQFIFATEDDLLTFGTLQGGSNGTMKKTNGEASTVEVSDMDEINGEYTKATVLTNTEESFVGQSFYVKSDAEADGSTLYPLFTDAEGQNPAGIYVKLSPSTDGNSSYQFVSYSDETGSTQWAEGTVEVVGKGENDANIETTRLMAYQAAFTKIQDVDLIGISTTCDSPAVQSALALHIEEVTDPEVHQLRFGITGLTGYKELPEDGSELPAEEQVTEDTLIGQASILDSEWMIFIGQGVVFEDEYGNRRNVLPHEATQLYTGIRSALGYSEAIFGGESKKVLNGVVDTLPVVTDGTDVTKELIEDLNESGVCTFKKEYGEVTFVEGVTTIQDRDVLSYENMMSIVAYVSKRLIKVAKPYQGQRLTEDLKSTLTTALLKELKDITETDGTLMELEEFNIPPYNVSVEAASKTMWDDHNLIRVSKIIIKCRIVPVGALRDIDLGVIAI